MNLENLKKERFSILFEKDLFSKIISFDYKKFIDFMGETWTYRDINLFEKVIHQCQGQHIEEYNDLTAKKNLDEAMYELFYAFENGRDAGINGFMWYEEGRDFFNENSGAILDYLDDLANDFACENVGELVERIASSGGFNPITDLLTDNGKYTKSILATQLMYEVSIDLNETTLGDYADAKIIDLEEIERLVNKNEQSKRIRKK